MGRYPVQLLRLFWRSGEGSHELADNEHAMDPLGDTKAG